MDVDPATIVVINLDERTDTLRAFQIRNAHLGPIRRFAAVAGAEADRRALRASGIIAGDLDYVDGALGCALSHRALWQEVAGGTRALTICEDDAVFAGDFVARANARLAALPDGWDIVLWGWNFDSAVVFELLPGLPAFLLHRDRPPSAADLAASAKAPASAQLFRLQRACGTLCYTISPHGAARLLAECTPLRPMQLDVPEAGAAWPNHGIDIMMSVFYPRLQAYVSVPPLVISPNAVAHSTTRLPVGGGLFRRAGTMPLPALIAEVADSDLAPHTEVELYKAWLLANPASGLLHAAWFNLGCAFVRARDYDRAIIAYQNVLTLKPDFAPAVAALGLLAARSTDIGPAWAA